MITSWIPEDGSADLRGWEWYYTFGNIHKNPVEFHAGASVNAMDFSPGGEWIAFSTSQRTAIRNSLNVNSGSAAAYQFSDNSIDADIVLWESGDAGYDAVNPYRNSGANFLRCARLLDHQIRE
jgi:hypothetical protein